MRSLTTNTLVFLSTLATLPQSVISHTWSEALNVIAPNGTLLEPPGYGRSFHARASPGWTGTETSDFQKVDAGVNNPLDTAKVCAPFQATQQQTDGFGRLKASPGDMVAIRYAENGHVTLLEEGRPAFGGLTWIYGTTQGSENPKLTDVMGKWDAAGTGGDKKGKLLAEQYFDDGRCYEKNGKSADREALAPVAPGTEAMGYGGMHCQSNFKIPDDAPINEPYSVFWVWNFSKVAVPELYSYYTFCMDIDIVDKPETASFSVASPNFQEQPAVGAAVPQYFKNMVDGAPVGDPADPVPPPQAPATQAPGQPTAQVPVPVPTAQSQSPEPTQPATSPGGGEIGVPVGAPPGAPIVSEPPIAEPTSAPAAQPSQPGSGVGAGVPSVSVPMSELSIVSADPAVTARTSAPAAAPTTVGDTGAMTVTQEVFKTVTIQPSMQTVSVTVTVEPPTSVLPTLVVPTLVVPTSVIATPIPVDNESATSSTSSQGAQGTGNVNNAAAAQSTSLKGDLYDRDQPRVPPSPRFTGRFARY